MADYPYSFTFGNSFMKNAGFKFLAFLMPDDPIMAAVSGAAEVGLWGAENAGLAAKQETILVDRPAHSRAIWLTTQATVYKVKTPYVKVFMQDESTAGKLLYSLFFKLGEYDTEFTVIPEFGGYSPYFKARAALMTTEEIASVYGAASRTFQMYTKQSLPKEYLRRIIHVDKVKNEMSLGFRKIRV